MRAEPSNRQQDFGIGDFPKVFVGPFRAEKVLGRMGVRADDDGDVQLFHFADQPLACHLFGQPLQFR